jgi:hypothetical protein
VCTIKPQHLIEAREFASAPKTPPPNNVIYLPVTVDVDMDITEIVPAERLEALRIACKGYTP